MISPLTTLTQANHKWTTARWLIISLFVTGLLVRIATIPLVESADVPTWVKWGNETYHHGLATSFQGAYFPIQYLIFTGAFAISEHAPINTTGVIKIFNLIFELGLLGLLAYLTRKHLPMYKLLILYWLNPFTIILSEQGYADVQMAFFTMMTLLIIWQKLSRYPYLLAGVPLGIAFLMKPQATPLLLGIGLLIFTLILRKDISSWKAASVFVFPIIFFLCFSLYFGLNLEMKGHETIPRISQALHQKIGLPNRTSDVLAKSTFLAAEYKYIPNIMSAINAHMPNPWYLVAESMRTPEMKIYRVKDTGTFVGITYRTWGLILFFLAFLILMIKIIRHNKRLEERILWVMLIIPVLLPYLTTNAHENHFFYGFASLIVMGALMKDRLVLTCGYLLGILNGLNVFYLFVLPHYYDMVLFANVPVARIALTISSSIVFLILLYHLISKANISVNHTEHGETSLS